MAGCDDFYCSQQQYRAPAGQVVLINPGEVHTGSNRQKASLCYLSLCPDPAQWKQVLDWLEIPAHANPEFQQCVPLSAELDLLFRSYYRSITETQSPLHCEESLARLLQALAALQFPQKQDEQNHRRLDARVEWAREIIEQEYKQPLSLVSLADAVHINPYYLIRLFKKTTGLTPGEYQLSVRVHKARTLLLRGHPVQQVAIATGFHDAAHMNRSFRRITGMSPGSFRSS